MSARRAKRRTAKKSRPQPPAPTSAVPVVQPPAATARTVPYGAWLAALALLLLTCAAYVPVLDAGYIWDDDDYVTENDTLHSAAGLKAIWLQPSATPQYYPLVHTSFWLEYQLWALAPTGYHAVNILLHGLAALLLWRVLRRLGLPGAFFAAAIFAVHPVQVESVAWVTERKNVLSIVFFLLALLTFLRFRPLGPSPPGQSQGEQPPRAWGRYVAALLFFAAALLSKTVTCALPAVLLLLAWWKEDRVDRRLLGLTAPFFALGLIFAGITVVLERTQVGAEGAAWDLSFVERCLIAGRALWFYAGKLLWPDPLIFVYPRWTIDAGTAWQYLFPAAFLLVVGLLWMLRRRCGRGPLVAVLLFAGMLFPALGFFNVYPMRFSFVADHFQYHASTALIALFAALASRAFATDPARAALPRWLAPALATVVVAGLAFLTWQRGQVYTSAEGLWRDTIAQNPDAWLAHSNLGALLYAEGRLAEAEAAFRETLRLYPGYPRALGGLSSVLGLQNRLAEAEHELEALVALRPRNAQAHNNLGFLRLQQQRFDEARQLLEKAVALDPTYSTPRRSLADLSLQQERFADAADHYEAVLQREPGDLALLQRTARAQQGAGDHGAAIATLRRARDVASDDLGVAGHLALLLATAPDAALRDGQEAVALAEEICRQTEYRNGALLDVLAAAYAEAGRFPEAVAAAERAVALARAAGRSQVASAFAANLERYRRGEPLRSP